ncbi:hypothetical protein D1B31_15765 [Neobacillus notoginsengisoli]|uniref:Uncharacterized protein n=1 Tax=Neobacillus notoginsengisoli TaxID=1578198 RepID=A0A417YR85_9BACI|nr:hypothetical protein [Neobacillus notoginsengisoli]RHW37227.1 hypothetical protein D1B31_15765 [Neobacillus notoginsengisoli]
MDRYKSNVVDSLEHLLESLIKMTGKTNEHVSTLHKRIAQLECRVAEYETEMKHGCRCQTNLPEPPIKETSFLIHL